MTVTPIGAVELGTAGVAYAPAMRAGPWVFATGLMADDLATGMDPAVIMAGNPHGGPPRHEREAAAIYRRLASLLAAGGADFRRVVRLDQYYTGFEVVDHYHPVRRAHFGASVPPSTSFVMNGFSVPGADLNVQCIAVAADSGLAVTPLDEPSLRGPATSGYVPASRAGDYVFLAGALALARGQEPNRRGLALAATRGEAAMWGGLPVRLEADFVLGERLKPALALAGASFADVLKAQIYLTNVEDTAAAHAALVHHLGAGVAATSIIPCRRPGLANEAARIEINMIALAGGAATRKEIIADDTGAPFPGQPAAVRAGNLLFLSGLMAADRGGRVAALEDRHGYPHYGDPAEREADWILARAAGLCRAAGTSLANVVRVQQFHTVMSDFLTVHRAWRKALPGRPIPFSAVAVPTLPVPGCRVLLDLWVYVP